MISCAIIIPIAWLLSQRIVTPIMQVVSGVRAVGQGEFDQEIPVTTGNELGLLAEEFNAAKTVGEAQAIAKQMETILFEDLPYLVLFTPPLIEAYRSSIEFYKVLQGSRTCSSSDTNPVPFPPCKFYKVLELALQVL